MALQDANIEISESQDFSGGWVQNRHPSQNESPDCLNVYAVDGKLKNLPGTTLLEAGQVLTPDDPSPIYLLTHHRNTLDIITQTRDRLYRIPYVINDTNQPPVDISGSVVFNTPDFHPSVVHYNDNLYGTDPNNVIWRVGEVGNCVQATTDIQSAYCLGVFKDRLIAAGIKVAGNWFYTSVCYSASDDASSFDVALDRWELETDSKEYPVHISVIGDALYIYKTHSIARITGYPPYDWVVERNYINGIGPVGRDCVKRGYLNIDGSAVEVDFFISYQGLFAFDGSSLTALPFGKANNYLRSFWKDLLWTSPGPHWVTATFDEDNGLYKCYFTDASNGNIRGIVYDCINNVIWPSSLPSIPRTMDFSIVPSDTIFDLHHHVIHGHDNGVITRETETTSLSHTGDTLITNGSFELDSNWTTYDPATTGTVTNERNSDYVYIGNYSRYIFNGAGTTTGGAYQTITGLTIGNTYRLYGYVLQSESGVASMEVVSGTTVIATATPSGSTPWEDMSVSFVATATSHIVRLKVSGEGESAYFDQVSMYKMDRDVYYKTSIIDMGSSYTRKLIKELGIEHSTGISSFTVKIDYNDDPTDTKTVTINQTPKSSETSRITSCTSSTSGITGKAFRRCQLTLTLANTGFTQPSWEISAILMSYNPTTTTFLFQS